MVRRLVVASIGFAVLVLASVAIAAPPAVDEFPVTFTLKSVDLGGTCPNLPSGTTIVGTGTEKSITTETTRRDGVTTVMNTSVAHGTATDQAGNTYVFNYANHFSVSDSGPGTDFSGVMVDAFSLAGSGPAHLSNGFRAIFTNFSSFTELTSRGDPIDFATGASLCDPL